MHTTAINQTAPVAEAGRAGSPSVGRRVARILGVLAILFAGLFTTLGTQAPAQAATSYNTGVSFCAWSDYYGTNHAYAKVRLQVLSASGTHWVDYRYGQAGGNGCGTFRNVDAGYRYRVLHYIKDGCWLSSGSTSSVGVSYNRISDAGWMRTNIYYVC